jgi:tetratricopeptide (TPR) repeat protein
MWRRLDDPVRLASALTTLAAMEARRSQPAAARSLLEEASNVARDCGAKQYFALALADLALLEHDQHDYERSLQLNRAVLEIAHEVENPMVPLVARHNIACTLRRIGRVEEARTQMHDLLPDFLKLNEPGFLVAGAEDYALILADLGHYHLAVKLLGAAAAMRARLGVPRDTLQVAEMAGSIAKARAAMSTEDWDRAYQSGQDTTVEEALAEVHAMDSQTVSTGATDQGGAAALET